MNDLEWDESNAFHRLTTSNKRIDISFLQNMEGDFCFEKRKDGWGRIQECIRIPEHTGRHLAVDLHCRYPVAVWR